MRFNGLDLNLLVALDMMLTERNISRAAEKMCLSQSAMSNALGRLREFFEDELLVQVGRHQHLTPRAEALREPVRELLVRTEATIMVQPGFDPATSNRCFRLLVSDYSTLVLLPHLLELAWQQSRTVRFEFVQQATEPARLLARGEVDLLIIPSPFISEEHPCEELLQETYRCVVWTHNTSVGDSISFDQYLAAGHAVLHFGPDKVPAFDEWFMRRFGVARRVEVSSASMIGVSALVVGTERIATAHTSLAQQAARIFPIRLIPAPIDIPNLVEVMQWHQYRAQDAGIAWLRGVVKQAAQRARGLRGAVNGRYGIK